VMFALLAAIPVFANPRQCKTADDPACTSVSEVGEPSDVIEVNCDPPGGAGDILGDNGAVFVKTYWNQRPVLIRRNCSSIYDALKVKDLSNFFPDAMAEGEENGQIELSSFRAGDEYVRIIHFYANLFLGYLDGASVVYNQFECFWPEAAYFTQQLYKYLPSIFKEAHHPALNLYVTPPGGNQIFPLHNDDQHVMILQVSGSKVWRVQYKPSPRYKGIKKVGTDEQETPALKAVLQPGDFLYVPRHHKHEGYTEDTHSVSASLTLPNLDIERERDDAADFRTRHEHVLEAHPLPTGRAGPLSMDTVFEALPVKGLTDRIIKDDAKLQQFIQHTIRENSEPTHHERSSSPRIVKRIAEGIALLNKGPARLGDFPGPRDDSFGKMSLGVVMNWLGFSTFI